MEFLNVVRGLQPVLCRLGAAEPAGNRDFITN
jgi:hypothetical protein